MTFLPVAHRELLAATRRPGMRRARVGAAIVASGVALLMLAFISVTGAGGQGGRFVFGMLSWGCALLAVLGGIWLTSDTVSMERRDGTLGFLFLTELDGVDVVTGKFTAHALGALYALAAVFPVLAIPWFVGGVTAGEFWKTTLALLNLLFVATTSGLATSAVCMRQAQAAWMAAWLTAVIQLAGPLASAGLGLALGGGPWLWPRALSPGHAFLVARDAAPPLDGGPGFAASLVVSHAVGWLLLAVSAWRVQAGWRAPAEPRDAGARRRTLSRPWLERDPLRAWLDGSGTSRRAVWCVAAVPWVGALPLVALPASEWAGPAGVLAVASSVVLLGWTAWETTAFLSEARRDGSLELLLSTPLRDAEVTQAISGHVRDRFLYPMLATAAAVLWLVSIWGGPIWACLHAVGMGLQWMVMPHVGMWFALTERRPMMAFAKTFGLVTVASSFLEYVCCLGLALPPVLHVWASNQLRLPLRDIVAGVRGRWQRRDGWWVAQPLQGQGGGAPPWRDPRPPPLPYQRRAHGQARESDDAS